MKTGVRGLNRPGRRREQEIEKKEEGEGEEGVSIKEKIKRFNSTAGNKEDGMGRREGRKDQ